MTLLEAVKYLQSFGLHAYLAFPGDPFISGIIYDEILDFANRRSALHFNVHSTDRFLSPVDDRNTIEEGFCSSIEGPGMSSTILAVHQSLEVVTTALIKFYQLKSDIPLYILQYRMWEIHKLGLWCEIDQNGAIMICSTTTPTNFYPDDFVLTSFGHVVTTKKLVITMDHSSFDLEFWVNDISVSRSQLAFTNPKEVAQKIWQEWDEKIE